MNISFETVAQVIATCGLVLGCTWKLSSQISSLEATLRAHMIEDDRRFGELSGDIDHIAPRQVQLVKGRR